MFAHINCLIELDIAVNEYADSLNVIIDKSTPYGECADFFDSAANKPHNSNNADSLFEMATVLRHAEARWHKLES